MSECAPNILIGDMLEAVERIQAYTEGVGFDDFVQDQKTAGAVLRIACQRPFAIKPPISNGKGSSVLGTLSFTTTLASITRSSGALWKCTCRRSGRR